MTTRGKRNHNPLNIRKGNNWQGENPRGNDPEFEVFLNDLYGLRAAFLCIKTYIKKHHCNTIRKLITRWAPPSENNTHAYINTVSQRSGVPADERIAFADCLRICQIVKAMAYVESQYEPSDRILASAYEMAK